VKNEFQVAKEIICKVIENTFLNKDQWWENAEFLKAIIDFLIQLWEIPIEDTKSEVSFSKIFDIFEVETPKLYIGQCDT
jgi:hypothetical protein